MDMVISSIESARIASGLSQRALANRAGISQTTLNRILSGDRVAKLPELMLIADAVGCAVSQLAGSDLANRVQCDTRVMDGTSMAVMRQRLLQFMTLDACLDEQAITL